MIAPIGTFLTQLDTTLNNSVDTLLAATTSMAAVPVALAAGLFYAVQGLRVANGDMAPVHAFVPQTIRVLVVVWLSSNLGAFNTWVRDVFYIGLPNALNSGIASAGGQSVASVGGVPGTAAAFDQVWAQMWIIVGLAHAQGGFLSPIDFAADIAAFTGGMGLFVMAMIYLLSRFVLAIVIVASPFIIACAMHEVTKPIFERGVGKIVALIFLQFAAIIVLQIVLTGDQAFMEQIIAAARAREVADAARAWYDLRGATASAGAAMATTVQNLVAMVIWLLGGAFAMYALPAVAYSIGSGIAISTAPSMLGAALALRASSQMLSAAMGKLSSMQMPSLPGGAGAGPNYALSLNRQAIAGNGRTLPPPPPPPLLPRT